jgi:hypothetical protein
MTGLSGRFRTHLAAVGNFGIKDAAIGSPAHSGQTTAFAVTSGDSVYVFVAYDATSTGATQVNTVTDTSSNTYQKAGIVQNTGNSSLATNPAIEVWYADNVPTNASLKVTVTFNGSSSNKTLFAIVAAEITGATSAGSLDAVSAGMAFGTGVVADAVTSASDPISIAGPGDLLLAVQCAVRPTGTVFSGGGFLSSPIPPQDSGGTTSNWPLNDVVLNVLPYTPVVGGTYNSATNWLLTDPTLGAILTVTIRSSSGLNGARAFTVSPWGLNTTPSSPIFNAGANFGPDTPGTTTSGIQEALNAASAANVMVVHLNSGLFKVKSQISWPAAWSGILEGSGATETSSTYPPGSQTDGSHVQAQSDLGGSGSILVLSNGSVNTVGCTMKDIYWDAAAVNLTNGVVDFRQYMEQSTKTEIWRCTFDAGTSTTPHSLLMDYNDDSILYHCTCWNANVVSISGVSLPAALRWMSPKGGNKIIGGVYDGMSLAFQNSTQIFVTNNTAWRVLSSSDPNARLNLYGCYKNGNADPAAGAPIVQNDNSNLYISVDGGFYYIDTKSGAGGTPFFGSTSSAAIIYLSIKNCFLNSEATGVAPTPIVNYLLSTNAQNVIADFDPNSVTIVETGVVTPPNTYVIDSQPLGPNNGQGSGYGIAHIVADNRLTGLNAPATGAGYVPLQDSDLEVSAEVYVSVAGGLATAIVVDFFDEGGVSRSLILPVLSPVAGSFGFSNVPDPIDALGPWVGATVRIRAKAGTPVTVSTSSTGSYAGSMYTFDSTIKILSSS